MEELKIKTGIQISAPPKEVFEAIVNPEKMSNYFIAEGSGRMENGQNITWKFPEFEEIFDIKVLKIIPSEFISFEWEGAANTKTQVEISISEVVGGKSLVKITEGTMKLTPEALKWYGGNTEGWANFSACLKAYLEHGINLRKGAFDYMKA